MKNNIKHTNPTTQINHHLLPVLMNPVCCKHFAPFAEGAGDQVHAFILAVINMKEFLKNSGLADAKKKEALAIAATAEPQIDEIMVRVKWVVWCTMCAVWFHVYVN